MFPIVHDKSKSVLCVGFIDPQRQLLFNDGSAHRVRYKVKLNYIYRQLNFRGFDSYFFLNWNFFTQVSAAVLQMVKQNLMVENGGNTIHSMGVISKSEISPDMQPYEHEFDDYIIMVDENPDQNLEAAISNLLDNTDAIIYDNLEHDPIVSSIIKAASDRGLVMYNVNPLEV